LNFELRELIDDDIFEIANIYVKAYADEDWNEQWIYEDALQRICEIISSPVCKGVVCLLNKKIVGCALYEILTWHTGKQLEIKEIFVNPCFHRNGIGKKLLTYIEVVGKAIGVSEAFLWTNNSKGLFNFYSQIGYREYCNTKQFIKKWRN